MHTKRDLKCGTPRDLKCTPGVTDLVAGTPSGVQSAGGFISDGCPAGVTTERCTLSGSRPAEERTLLGRPARAEGNSCPLGTNIGVDNANVDDVNSSLETRWPGQNGR